MHKTQIKLTQKQLESLAKATIATAQELEYPLKKKKNCSPIKDEQFFF